MQVITTAATIDKSSAISNQVTVDTAGVRKQGPNMPLTNGVYVKALSTNSGRVFVGDSTVSASVGWELLPGEISPPIQVNNANDLYFDADANSQSVCLLKA